jgi:hypothetical protein
MGVGGERYAPAALPPGKRTGTHCVGGWVGPKADLYGCENSRLHRASIPGPSQFIVTVHNTEIVTLFLLSHCSQTRLLRLLHVSASKALNRRSR